MGIINLFLVAGVLLIAVGVAALVHQFLHPPRKTYAVALARQLPADPADLGLTAEAWTFDLADGNIAAGWVIDGRDATGPTVIFTHGWGDSRFGALTWVPLIEAFAARIVVYDLRGHGDSTAAASRAGTSEVADLLAVIDQVQADTDGPSAPAGNTVVLLGHCLGAGISMAAAARDGARRQSRVRGVIADGAARRLDQPLAWAVRTRGWPVFPLVPLAAMVVAVWTCGKLRGVDYARDAVALGCPLLLLHGAQDPLARLDSARQIHAAAPDARLVVFQDAGHGNLAHLDPARYGDELTRFFARVRSGGQCTIETRS